MVKVEAFDHLVLVCQDVERTLAWYQDVLGLERRYEEVWGDFPAVVGAGTTALALFPTSVAEPTPPPGREVLSVRHIAFRVDRATFDRARGHLEARGITATFEDHSAAHSLYFADPDGHRLEITTYDVPR